MIVLDTSALYAALVETERHHDRALGALEQATQPFVLSPFVLCELDFLLRTSVGVETEVRFLEEVAAGAYDLAAFDAADLSGATEVVERYADLRLGLADASIVVLADRYATDSVFTLDERHFRALRTRRGAPFTILPAAG